MSQSEKDRLAALENRLSILEGKMATEETPGLVRLSPSKSVTDSTGLAMPASENNAALDGTLANEIGNIQESIHGSYTYKHSMSTVSFADAAKEVEEYKMFHCLDTFVSSNLPSIPSQGAKEGWITTGGAAYFVKLQKWNNSIYCGYIDSYYMEFSLFKFRNGVFDVMKLEQNRFQKQRTGNKIETG